MDTHARRRSTAALTALATLANACWGFDRFDPPFATCEARRGDHRVTVTPTTTDVTASDDTTYDATTLTVDTTSPQTSGALLSIVATNVMPPLPAHVCAIGGRLIDAIDCAATLDALPASGAGVVLGGDDWFALEGARVENVWAGVRLHGMGTAYVRDVYVRRARYGCVLLETGTNLYLADSLLDACNEGFAYTNMNAAGAPNVFLDGVLVHLAPMPLSAGVAGHGWLSTTWSAVETGTHLRLRDTTLFVEQAPMSPSGATPAPTMLFPANTTFENVTLLFDPSVGQPRRDAMLANLTGAQLAALTVATDADGSRWAALADAWLAAHAYAPAGPCP